MPLPLPPPVQLAAHPRRPGSLGALMRHHRTEGLPRRQIRCRYSFAASPTPGVVLAQDAERKRVIVVGGGIGGLVAGGRLAKEGYDVVLLEQNTEVGRGADGGVTLYAASARSEGSELVTNPLGGRQDHTCGTGGYPGRQGARGVWVTRSSLLYCLLLPCLVSRALLVITAAC